MILKNYSINTDLIAIEVDGQYLDLHNNYDYEGYAKNSDYVVIGFNLTDGDWVPDGLPPNILLRISELSYFDHRGGAPGKDISEIGFFPNSTFGKVDYQGNNIPLENAGLLVVRFVSGAELAMVGQESSCMTMKSV